MIPVDNNDVPLLPSICCSAYRRVLVALNLIESDPDKAKYQMAWAKLTITLREKQK